MDRYPQGRGTIPTRDEEEQFGLLDGEKEVTSSDGSISDEEEWNYQPNIQSQKPKKSWLRTVVITLLILCTLGFIIHSFVAPHKNEITTHSVAQLRPEEDYILDPDWDFEAEPTTREYNFTIAEHELNPDGVYRRMILINGMFPGPLIECNEGDEIVVHVRNRASNSTAIHWHGLYQNGTNWMDGTVGVTQCPIAPGQDFTYKFKVDNQSGTYYYHSHMSVQASDGLVGPLIIHSRKEEELQKIPYGSDRVVMVSDHYYDLSSALLMDYLAPDAENKEPVPPSALINGRNIRNCTTLPNRTCSTTNRTTAFFDLPSDTNTRLRFINVGAFAEFQIQIDEHDLYISEVDGTDVMPQTFHRLNILPAQRYSVILIPPTENKGLYWLRARMVTHCFAYENPELQEEVRAVLKYWAPGDSVTPTSLDWNQAIEVECRDLNTSALHPVIAIPAPETADDKLYLRSTFQIRDWALSRGYLNDSTYRPDLSHPTLMTIINSSSNAVLLAETSSGDTHKEKDPYKPLIYSTPSTPTAPVIDILVQNFDDGTHPFHLHGHTFFILTSGHGYPPPTLPPSVDLSNPLRRDTVSVEGYAWVWIRFVADNPGVWAFHCHNAWHMEAGLGMQILVGRERVRGWEVPGEVEGLCEVEGGLLERGKGPEDGLWFGMGMGEGVEGLVEGG